MFFSKARRYLLILVITELFVPKVWSKNHVEISINATTTIDNRTMTSYRVEPLPDSHAELGEGPHWSADTQSLYYVDIGAGKLLRYSYNENKVYKAKIEGIDLAGFVIPVENSTDRFVVGAGRKVIVVRWDGVSTTAQVEKVLFEVEMNDKRFDGNRFNDGKCDPQGRLFAGTMRYVGDEFEHRYGSLYRYTSENGGKWDSVKGDIGISNGLTWNEKSNKFYYIDTTDFEVKEYDYNFKTGEFSNPKVVFNLRKDDVKTHLLPDGMTIDTEGNIYVATFNGYSIFKVDPKSGTVLQTIKFPCKQITSVAFGGPALDVLFVTTASRGNEPEPAGTTYKVSGLGAKGLPMAKCRI